MKKLLLIMIPVLALAGCQHHQAVPAINLANLDTTVSPAVNFYEYANGGWQKANPLKPEFARYGVFDVLNDTNETRLNRLFKEMGSSSAKKGSIEQKIADLYKMGMDSVKLNSDGSKPIQKYLDTIQRISDKQALMKELGILHKVGEDGFFGAYVNADMKNSDSQILYLGQVRLGMGDRDYYIDPANAALKEGYRNFLVKVLALSGVADPQSVASNDIAMEDAMARISWDSVQERDVEKQYNPTSSLQLEKTYPDIDFKSYFEARNIPDQKVLVVGELSYFQGLDSLFKVTPVEPLRDYVLCQFISGACNRLSDDYYTASWDFFSRQMAGAKAQRPRWRRSMQVPNHMLGEAVGQIYVKKYFPESSKKKMVALVENLRTALGQHIRELDWMSDSTKIKAQEKLAAFTVKIGYPDKWKDYTSLNVDPSLSYYDNLRAASTWAIADMMSKLGKPTDKTEWGMSPQTVNAYYDPSTNEICFPAAILQPPFFNPDADEAVNYGGIGVVICHEMTHGFDDQGRLFDKDGNLTNWWTAEDAAKFNAKAEVLAAQFDSIEVLPGIHANGHHTLGENIADHGGLSVAYTAMENAIKGKRPGLIDGFTPEQRFYISYASVWAQNITPEAIALRTKTDEHSLGLNRVNVSVRNFQTFFDAFGIKEGDPMFRPMNERVHIW